MIKALKFDTGDTILDWPTGISKALGVAAKEHGLERGWPAIANDYRMVSLKAMAKAGVGP